MAKLTFVLEQGQEVVVPLTDAVALTLGRGDDNDVVVDDARISTHHATLELSDDGRLEVRDMNSAAGTYVNGRRVQASAIRDGDTVSFGPLTALVDLKEHKGVASTQQNRTPPRQAALRDSAEDEAVKRLRAEKLRLEQEVRSLQAQISQHEARQKASAQKEREQQEAQARQHEARKLEREREITEMQAKAQAWQERAAQEVREHSTRLDALHADEKRLAHVTDAVREAEALHQQWVEAVRVLSAQHQDKETDMKRLIAAEEAARHEIESLATHKDQELAHLKQVRDECAHAETHLDALRQQIATQEERHKRMEDLANAREDQLQLAEKKLAEILERRTRLEAEVKQLAGEEEKLSQAHKQREMVLAAISMLEAQKQELESNAKGLQAKLTAIQTEQSEAVEGLEETREKLKLAEENLRGLETSVKKREEELAAETARLQEASARRAEIISQCEELADTKQELAAVVAQVAEAEKQQQELAADVASKQARIAEIEVDLKAMTLKEDSAKGRLEVLHGRENDLRAELGKLAASEHSTRVRFEEIRQLLSEVEQEHAARMEEHATAVKASQQEMQELESKLAPLRDWKEAMDQLYARLATLPEGSKEARELWQEIEKEKNDLKKLISTARSQAQGTAARKAPAALEPEEKTVAEAVRAASPPHPNGVHPLTNGHSHQPAHNHGLAMATVQERTLNSRLLHLRESVVREESRLEFLRQERGRQETRLRTGTSAAGAAMQREHDRHLESKIRHDEEQLTALQQHIEQAKTEEEKRRAKIVEMEHKLAELNAGITEAERHRSELRHQADLAHTELKNFESAHERLKKAAEEEAAMEQEMATAWGPAARGV